VRGGCVTENTDNMLKL